MEEHKLTSEVKETSEGYAVRTLIHDDPNHYEPTSEAERLNVLAWWKDVMLPREGDSELRLIVQSRLHEYNHWRVNGD